MASQLRDLLRVGKFHIANRALFYRRSKLPFRRLHRFPVLFLSPHKRISQRLRPLNMLSHCHSSPYSYETNDTNNYEEEDETYHRYSFENHH